MAFLSAEEKARITEAIKQAESRTSGEIVTVIAKSADAYWFIPLLWAAVMALSVPAVVLLVDPWIYPVELYGGQLLLFAVLALLFRWTPLKMRLVPGAVKRRRAGRLAREQFLAQGLHHTKDRTGVLLFVSVAEHYVEVLADSGIDEMVAPDAWTNLVDAFVVKVKEKRVADGFLEAVDGCGAVLAEHFPKAPGDKDELPNHLIEF